MPKPIPKPSRTEEVLATVAARYAAGATVTRPSIAEASGPPLPPGRSTASRPTVGQVRSAGFRPATAWAVSTTSRHAAARQ
jgi:hypothetical protein